MNGYGVLVVDDDKNLRESLCEILELSGIDAYGAASGAEALAAAARKPALVLADFQLPDTDGYKLCRDLKSMPGETVRVMVMTGRMLSDAERAAGDAAGVDEYLFKPFDIAALCRRIGGFFKERNS
ncbi:MAG: response regulator [Elusimicrobiaceae bacterium]|nr:response regulator [Elusimicrobiaceae bacterium]